MAVILKNHTAINNGITSTPESQFEPRIETDPTYYGQIDAGNSEGTEDNTVNPDDECPPFVGVW